MIEKITLFPGITLRCCTVDRFKQGCFSLAFVRPMSKQEAPFNALLPALLLRGCQKYPDLRSITHRLDDLYGAALSPLVRRIGDYQTTGFYCGFMEDAYALSGDRILQPLLEFLQELIFRPLLSGDAFLPDYVDREKKNLISIIEAQRNDKRSYAGSRLLEFLCAQDAFGIPRLGTVEQVQAITPQELYRHYCQLLQSAAIEIFYVGTHSTDTLADMLRPLFAGMHRNYQPLPPQTPLKSGPEGEHTEQMDVTQGKLCMGYTTPVTLTHPDFPAMQLLNIIFGGGMISKLFMVVREQQSLCYDIGSSYYGAKGILTVSAGIDSAMAQKVQQEVSHQLQLCCQGKISQQELTAAREALLSSLRIVYDSPGGIESFYATAALSGLPMDVKAYMQAVCQVDREQLIRIAAQVRLHSVYLLKGED